jgi:hypothetical protein
MVTMIVGGRLVPETLAARVGVLFDRATQLRHDAEVEHEHAKRLLRTSGIRAISVITERGAYHMMQAQRATDEACRLLDECPLQTVADETWTG